MDELLALMEKSFPELGLTKEDCIETTWIESEVTVAGYTNGESIDVLLNRTPITIGSYKMKSDYVKEPMPVAAFEGIWERLQSEEIEVGQLLFVPYGGKMSEISDSDIPFSHRAGNLYKIGYMVSWEEQNVEAEKRHVNWIREFYSYMAPFVSKSPRAAYVNYRDLDIGTNNMYGKTSYKQAEVWGLKYFGNNFNRLLYVKTKVDPFDFFRHEQSIPSLLKL